MSKSTNTVPTPYADCAFCARVDDITLIPCSTSPSPCPACASALYIHAQIVSSKSTLHTLLAQQSALHASINARHDILSSNLPPEIIGRIFEWCVPSEELYEAPGMTPFVLSTVSRTWRTIAFGTKLLWASVAITLSRDDPSGRADFADRWIARSGDKPLYLIVSSADKANEVSVQSAQLTLAPYFSVINGCSSRWRTLVLNVSTNVLKKIVGDGLHGAPNLESLSLEKKQFKDIDFQGRGGGFNSGNSSSRFSLMGEDVPSPAPVTISLKGFTSQSLFCLNLDTLTTFTASKVTSADVLYVLEAAPSLTSCTFDNVCYVTTDDPVIAASMNIPLPSPTIHQCLSSLSISNESRRRRRPETPLHRIFDTLTLPALKTLEIVDHVQLIVSTLSDLVLRSSSPKITSLTLSDLSPDPDTSSRSVFSMLEYAFPSLESLIWRGCTTSEPEVLFRNLSTFPELRRLELEVVGERVWEWSTVVRLFDCYPDQSPTTTTMTPGILAVGRPPLSFALFPSSKTPNEASDTPPNESESVRSSRRLPLASLKLTLKPDEEHMALNELFSQDTTQDYIDLESLVHLEKIRREDQGVSVVIESADGEDMIAASREVWDARNVFFSN